jgi:hypothetical protein
VPLYLGALVPKEVLGINRIFLGGNLGFYLKEVCETLKEVGAAIKRTNCEQMSDNSKSSTILR